MAIIEYVVVGDFLKAYSLALCCSENSYISSFDKSARGWFSSFYQNFEIFYFLFVMMIPSQYFLDKNYFLYLKVHLPFSHFPSLK